MTLEERMRVAPTVRVCSCSQVAAFVPFSVVPERLKGKLVALVEFEDTDVDSMTAEMDDLPPWEDAPQAIA